MALTSWNQPLTTLTNAELLVGYVDGHAALVHEKGHLHFSRVLQTFDTSRRKTD